MSLVKHVSAAVFAVFLALPFAACSGGASSVCSDYCQQMIACTTPATCTLQDPSAAQSACTDSCESGLAAVGDANAKPLEDCLTCLEQATPAGQCILDSLPSSCDALCNTAAVKAAGETWSTAMTMPSSDTTGGLCTNGRNLFGDSECMGGGDGMSCSLQCCNGKCGETPDVGVTCDTTASPVSCTCTQGKNKGKTFAPAGTPCETNELWNQCNM